MKLVEDARQAWRWLSMRCMAAAVALQGSWELVPDDMKAGLPPKLVTYAALGLLVLGMAGRLIDQTPKDKP